MFPLAVLVYRMQIRLRKNSLRFLNIERLVRTGPIASGKARRLPATVEVYVVLRVY